MENLRLEKDFCFCTLALGKIYRMLALLLAQDIEKYSPNTSLIILTDYPSDFSNQANVLAFWHQRQGITCYHDKRFAIAHALHMFNSCIFIEPDMRILGKVSEEIKWLPGITAKSGRSIIKHNKNRNKELAVIQEIGQELNLNLADTKFVNESLFAVTRDSGREIEFLNIWGMLGPYFELRGIYGSGGNAIGLAAAHARLPVRFDSKHRFLVFKNAREQARLKNYWVIPYQKIRDFERQRMRGKFRRSLFPGLIDKIGSTAIVLYRISALIISLALNKNFYCFLFKNDRNY